MKAVSVLMFCLVTLVNLGGSHQTSAQETGKRDAWLESKRPLTGNDVRSENEISSTLIREVKVTRLASAEKLLESVSFVALTSGQVGTYFDAPLEKDPKLKPYLIRGVFLNSGGEFRVFYENSKLIVTHSSLGGGGKFFRCPLLVYLPSSPESVHVYASSYK